MTHIILRIGGCHTILINHYPFSVIAVKVDIEKRMNAQRQLIEISVENVLLKGDLVIPETAVGLVIFSHGSGSSRLSPRNNFVAQQLQRRGLATFLFDLLTEEEDQVYSMRFNINLLSQRLTKVTQYLINLPQLRNLTVGYFGASTGAASALISASFLQNTIKAIVSRGGRPDLAMDHLAHVKAPTLLIVGEDDFEVMLLNREAMEKLPLQKELKIIHGATHLFEEPGALEQVAESSGDWFLEYLAGKNKTRDSVKLSS
jgi:predicted alpha/beta-hydrolase family hydrolase